MRRFGTLAQEEELKRAVSTPSWGGNAARVAIRLGDTDVSDFVEEAKWGSSEGNSPTLTFEGKVSGYVPWEYENAPLEVHVFFGGFDILEFRGVKTHLKYDGESSTTLSSFSPGGYLDKVPLKEFVEYWDMLPEYAIRDAVFRIRSYNRGDVVIQPFGRPIINYNQLTSAAGQGFEEEDNPASILSRVFDTVGAVAVDTQKAGFRAFSNPYLGIGSPLAWAYNTDDLLDWSIPELAAPDEQYTSVIVSHADEGQAPETRIKRKWDVNWGGYRYPPIEDIPLYIAFNDKVGNADSKAADLAVRNARALSAGRYKTSFIAPYNPFLEKYDTLKVAKDRFRDLKGPWVREWLAVADAGVQTRFASGVALETIVTCTLTNQKKERVADRLHVIGQVRPVKTSGIIGRFAGIDVIGLWWNPEYAESFSGIDAGGLWIDTSSALEYVGTTAGGLWIDPEGTGRLSDVEIDEGGLYINTETASPKWMGTDEGGLFVDTVAGIAWTGADGVGLWLDPEGAAGA